MSRIGNKVVTIPEGVNVVVQDCTATVKGPKGELCFTFNSDIKVEVKDNGIVVSRPSDLRNHRALHGTTRALLNNMVNGVSKGFEKGLEIKGVGYRAQLQGKKLILNAGFSHLVEMVVPEGLTVEVPINTEIIIKGIDRQLVGEFAANIRAVRPPEPYKGKGIRYKGEHVRRKEGKTAK